MPLEQITTDYETNVPVPKGMVRTEMGKLVNKAKAAADKKSFEDAMQAQFLSRKKASKLKTMKKA